MFSPEFLQQVALFTVPVLALVELVKRTLKAAGWVAVAISIVASFVACVPVISGQGVLYYGVMSLCVAASANGVFKAFNKPV